MQAILRMRRGWEDKVPEVKRGCDLLANSTDLLKIVKKCWYWCCITIADSFWQEAEKWFTEGELRGERESFADSEQNKRFASLDTELVTMTFPISENFSRERMRSCLQITFSWSQWVLISSWQTYKCRPLFQVLNAKYPINVEVMHKVCSIVGAIRRIVCFERSY